MAKILVLTGATGKKSGGILTENIGKNMPVPFSGSSSPRSVLTMQSMCL